MLHALANVTTKIATIVMQKIIASCSAGNMSNCSLVGYPLSVSLASMLPLLLGISNS